jgi:hypothetical protein
VVADFGDDGLFLGTVMKPSGPDKASGLFRVKFHDGEEEDIQWFEIVKMQSERPIAENGTNSGTGSSGSYSISLGAQVPSTRKDNASASRYGWVSSERKAAGRDRAGGSGSGEADSKAKDDDETDDDDLVQESWVQCESCGKWRKFVSVAEKTGSGAGGSEGDASFLLAPDEKWFCHMNVADRSHSSCEDPEEEWDDENENESACGDDTIKKHQNVELSKKSMMDGNSTVTSEDFHPDIPNSRKRSCVDLDPTSSLAILPHQTVDGDGVFSSSSKTLATIPAATPTTLEGQQPESALEEKRPETLLEEKWPDLACGEGGLSREDFFARVQARAVASSAAAAGAEAGGRTSSRSRRDLSSGQDGWRCDECDVRNTLKNVTCFKCGARNPAAPMRCHSRVKKSQSSLQQKIHGTGQGRHEAKEAEEEDEDEDGPCGASAAGFYQYLSLLESQPLPDLVVSFSLFDSGGTAYPYYRLCAINGVMSLAKGLRRCGLDDGDDNDQENEREYSAAAATATARGKRARFKKNNLESVKKKKNKEPDKKRALPRRVRFVAHVGHLVDDYTLRQVKMGFVARNILFFFRIIRYQASRHSLLHFFALVHCLGQ